MKTPQTPVIWEPNYDTHTEAAVNNAINNYGKNITTTSGVVPYHGVSAPIASTFSLRSAMLPFVTSLMS